MTERVIITDPIRSTLFGKFYEEILRGWFETMGFEVYEGKPRVYWKDQPVPSIKTTFEGKLIDSLIRYRNERQFCTPDGFIKKDRKYFVWEAKNWPLWPNEDMSDFLEDAAWLLTKVVTYRGTRYKINGIIFSWWEKPTDEREILRNVRNCISPISFDVYYTKDTLLECVETLPDWYVKIIRKHKQDIVDFFEQLLGKKTV